MGFYPGYCGHFYEFQITTISDLERRMGNDLKKWSGLPKSLSSIALYGNIGKLTLPLKPIQEKSKVLRAREVLELCKSTEPKVSGAGLAVRTGRKWKAEAAVEE